MKPMVVAGVMSGTSADGVDVAVCRVSPAQGGSAKVALLAHVSVPYRAEVRAAVLAAMDSKRTTTAELSRLHWRLGAVYAEAVAAAMKATKAKVQMVALHGQTVYHQAEAREYLGAATRTTWQVGEASVVAERLRLPVVSDFRPADLAAGGQGAPLVPMLDYTMFRDAKRNRVLLNLGGIANMTAMPAGAGMDGLLAFDTGPANMVVDALMMELAGKRFDRGGEMAARGVVLRPVVERFLREPYFAAGPPKSCGREEFGAAFSKKFLAACQKLSAKKADAVATATALTAESVVRAYAAFVWPHLGQRAPLAKATEVIAAGGGAHNAYLMRLLREGLAVFGVTLKTTAEVKGALPIEAKEAAAFALLGWLTWQGLPGNVPAATGAKRAVVLGKITHG